MGLLRPSSPVLERKGPQKVHVLVFRYTLMPSFISLVGKLWRYIFLLGFIQACIFT
jgi:hypothetical protein